MFVHRNLRYAMVMLATGLPLVAGCGQPTGKISGEVTYKGSPVTAGAVSFRMAEKGIVQDAKIDANGSFVMTDPLPVGTYQVCYIPPTPEPQDPAKGPPPVVRTNVPQKYQDPQTSNLSVPVKAGKNALPIAFE